MQDHIFYRAWIHFSFFLMPEERKNNWNKLKLKPDSLTSQNVSLSTWPWLLEQQCESFLKPESAVPSKCPCQSMFNHKCREGRVKERLGCLRLFTLYRMFLNRTTMAISSWKTQGLSLASHLPIRLGMNLFNLNWKGLKLEYDWICCCCCCWRRWKLSS